ncbi:MAG: hypothetical protein SO130_01910 [Agathobacter sp.]|nr:hypothetical protein [Agathobacter sp.]
MSSWVYGDPAPPILRAYVGDPAKIRLIHGGVKETHVFHLHNHQWRLEGDNPNSTIIDSISISPQECYTLDILHGAGSLNGTIGDVIFHCHLYPHFHEGMWTLWRIYDRLEDGTGRQPDGTVIPPLMPLKDRIAPPKKDRLHPGYPNFIEGTFGEPPLQPPLGVLDRDGNNFIKPTELERTNFVPDFKPGALYCETCPCHTDGGDGRPCKEEKPGKRLKPLCRGNKRILPLPPCPGSDAVIRKYEIAAVQKNIRYNKYGDHDPDGLIFVPLEEADRAMREDYQPKPLVLRANAGDWIEVTLHNLFDKSKPVPYRSGSLKWDVESGMWGIFRVKKHGIGCACKNLCRKIKGICGKG